MVRTMSEAQWVGFLSLGLIWGFALVQGIRLACMKGHHD